MATSSIKTNKIKSGDTITIGQNAPLLVGYVATNTQIDIVVPLSVEVAEGLSVSSSKMTLSVYKADGTRIVNAVDVANTSGYTLTIALSRNIGLIMTLKNSSLNFGSSSTICHVVIRASDSNLIFS